jgi:hypothetical protein
MKPHATQLGPLLQSFLVKSLCTQKRCAAGRGAESLMQSGEARRNASGSSGSPEGESQRGQEHVRKAGGTGRR